MLLLALDVIMRATMAVAAVILVFGGTAAVFQVVVVSFYTLLPFLRFGGHPDGASLRSLMSSGRLDAFPYWMYLHRWRIARFLCWCAVAAVPGTIAGAVWAANGGGLAS